MTRVTEKGQVTIPKIVREQLGIEPGDEVEFVKDSEGYRVRKRKTDSPFLKWRGFLSEFAGQRSDELVDEMRGR
jgi:AbrB family looped-hinge helix DNA binding protein